MSACTGGWGRGVYVVHRLSSRSFLIEGNREEDVVMENQNVFTEDYLGSLGFTLKV